MPDTITVQGSAPCRCRDPRLEERWRASVSPPLRAVTAEARITRAFRSRVGTKRETRFSGKTFYHHVAQLRSTGKWNGNSLWLCGTTQRLDSEIPLDLGLEPRPGAAFLSISHPSFVIVFKWVKHKHLTGIGTVPQAKKKKKTKQHVPSAPVRVRRVC